MESTNLFPADWRSGTVLNAAQTGGILGINKNGVYAGIERGEIPSIRIGRRIVVPVAALRRMLGELPGEE